MEIADFLSFQACRSSSLGLGSESLYTPSLFVISYFISR